MVVLTTLFHHRFKTQPVSLNNIDYFDFVYENCRSTFFVNEVVNRLTMKMISTIFLILLCRSILFSYGMFQNKGTPVESFQSWILITPKLLNI